MLGKVFLEIMKVIYCSLDVVTARKILGVDDWGAPEEFEPIYDALRKDVFHGLCMLDDDNLEKLVQWAARKATPVDAYQVVAELVGANRAKVKSEAFTAQYCNTPPAPPTPKPDPKYSDYERPYEVPANESKEDRERRLAWEHYDKYAQRARLIGVSYLKYLMPVSPEDLVRAYQEDTHLNNIPLQRWDAMDASVRRARAQVRGPDGSGVFFWSLSDTVCLLKHVAIYHVIGVEPPPKYEPPQG